MNMQIMTLALVLFAQVAPKEPPRVGEVIIVGNTVTQDRVIREQLDLYPGQILHYPTLRVAEQKLARLGIFKVDTRNGIRPTVQVLESEGVFKDILVKVEESVTGGIKFSAATEPITGPFFRMQIEERNFDLFRWPTSLADISDGRAFRGGGQNLRLEITWTWFGSTMRVPATPKK